MSLSWLTTAVLIGLASAVHCIGMCGSIIGALTLSLPPGIRAQRRRLLPFLLAYNGGRILSYTLAGALAGILGAGLSLPFGPLGHRLLRGFSALWIALVGLHLAGWFPAFARIERLGTPLWHWLEPRARTLLPIRHPATAFGFGMLWGWLPCGLVYSTLIWSIGAGNPGDAALLMLGFGIGTLPATFTTGLFTGWAMRFLHHPRLRPALGVGLLLLALGTLAWPHLKALDFAFIPEPSEIDPSHGRHTQIPEQ
ncbi:MAG: sulfite exporter TauE/SafE family protein [Gammaproteobacteria bacterium]|nr:MAG: sulfite exporter TauE/SafE family protein [Gammaproteobacteria bacterium]